MLCRNQNNPHEVMLCTLNRMDQSDDKEFECIAFEKMNNMN